MKKFTALLLSVILMFLLAACGSKPSEGSSAEPDETQQSEPSGQKEETKSPEELLKQYVGKYRLVELVSDGEDMTDTYAKGWEDKSLYSYIEITESGEFIFKGYSKTGGFYVFDTFYLDPTDFTLHKNPNLMDKAVGDVSYENGRITRQTQKSTEIYELSNEIPEDPVD